MECILTLLLFEGHRWQMQGGGVVEARLVLAERPDSGGLATCPVTVTDRGNGAHQLSFTTHTVRCTPRLCSFCNTLAQFYLQLCFFFFHTDVRVS